MQFPKHLFKMSMADLCPFSYKLLLPLFSTELCLFLIDLRSSLFVVVLLIASVVSYILDCFCRSLIVPNRHEINPCPDSVGCFQRLCCFITFPRQSKWQIGPDQESKIQHTFGTVSKPSSVAGITNQPRSLTQPS